MKYEAQFAAVRVECPPEKANAWRKTMLDLYQVALRGEAKPEIGLMDETEKLMFEREGEIAH
jgi:hypothetical protein